MIKPSGQIIRISTRRASDWAWLGLVMGFVFLVGLYAVSRFSGRWAEGDSAAFTNWIRAFSQEGRLVPVQDAYPNGFAYQSISTFILALTGIDVVTLQQLVYPLLAFAVVLPAWLFYRELIESARGATLAVVLLFIQPEFLFVLLRSSHEKFTRSLMFFCLFLLLRGFKMRDQPRSFAISVGLFYLAAGAFITSNNLLAHSFILAVATAMGLGWLLEKRKTVLPADGTYRRLFYIALIGVGLVYLFTFYIYPPASHDLAVLKDTGNRIAALLLDVQSKSTTAAYSNPYAYISFGWVSSVVYFAVSLADWLILGISFAIWLRQGLRWLIRGVGPQTRAGWFLWVLYAAFAIQGAFSIVADLSGALGGNLQHRIFPSFSMIGVAMIASALVRWRAARFAVPARLGLSLAIFCVAILSVLKATNEPVLSNKWTFYQQGEVSAMRWADAHLAYSRIGTELDERLRTAFFTVVGASAHNNSFDDFDTPVTFQALLVTQVTRLRSSRLHQPIPAPPDALKVYDNGTAELYRVRPQTPYQH